MNSIVFNKQLYKFIWLWKYLASLVFLFYLCLFWMLSSGKKMYSESLALDPISFWCGFLFVYCKIVYCAMYFLWALGTFDLNSVFQGAKRFLSCAPTQIIVSVIDRWYHKQKDHVISKPLPLIWLFLHCIKCFSATIDSQSSLEQFKSNSSILYKKLVSSIPL